MGSHLPSDRYRCTFLQNWGRCWSSFLSTRYKTRLRFQIVAGLEKEAASAALPQFTRLLTLALDFRRQHANGSAAQVRAAAELVESEASSSVVCLVMRLSEVELRPLFLHLCEWKAGVSGVDDNDLKATLGVLDRRLSFYRVLDGLAGALKVTPRRDVPPLSRAVPRNRLCG